MKCKDIKLLMMDLMYDEISDENKSILKKHLAECAECQAEYNEMKQVSGFLDNWQEESAPVQVTFTAEENSILDLFKRLLPNFNSFKKPALVFASVLFIMALFNTKIEIKDGNFSFETSLLPKVETVVAEAQMTPEMLEKIRYENFKLTSQLLETYEAKDEKQTMVLLDNLVEAIRKERQSEYTNLVGTVNKAYQANDYRIQQTSHTVDEIVELLNKRAQNK